MLSQIPDVQHPGRRRRSHFFSLFGVALLATALLPAVTGNAAPPTPAKATACDAITAELLRTSSDNTSGWASVILRFSDDQGMTPAREAEVRGLGGYVYRRLPIIDSAACRVPRRSLKRLAALPFVARLSSDAPVRKSDEFTVEHTGADVAWNRWAGFGYTGSGVGVAVLDSGIRDHEDFGQGRNSRLTGSANFVTTGKKNDADPCGHGTHVAGIVAGDGSASSGVGCFRTFYGIAPEANLISVRVLDEVGQGDVSSVIRGIEWVLANRNAYKIRVLNISLGHPVGESYTTDPLCTAVAKAWKAGLVVVCAAGNGGRLKSNVAWGRDNEGYGTAYGSIQSPANSPYVITVGAMKQGLWDNRLFDRLASYSGRGPSRMDLVLKPDIVAPGNEVISTLANNSYIDDTYGAANAVLRSEYRWGSFQPSNDYFRLSGTSMAAPVVSGAVALLLQKTPSLSPDSVKARLMASADKWTLSGGQQSLCSFGAGYLDIPAALQSTLVATAPALSPTLVRSANGTLWLDPSIMSPDGSVWGTGKVGGSQAIWGGGVRPNGQLAYTDENNSTNIASGPDPLGASVTGVDLTTTAAGGDK